MCGLREWNVSEICSLRLVHWSLSFLLFPPFLHLSIALFPSAGVLAEAVGSQAACECSASGDPALFVPESLFPLVP